MLTILHTESSVGWGGQENRTLHECVGLKKLGERAIVLCKPDSKLKTRAASAGIEVRTHPMRSNRDLFALFYLLRLIKEESVDVISTHSGDDSLLGAVAGRLSRRKPVIVRTRHLALPITSRLTYSLLPHRVVTVSEHVRQYLINDEGISPEHVVTVFTGVDLARFDPDNTPDTLRESLGADKNTLIVGTIAILRRKKGHHVLLEAISEVVKKVPNVLFVFAGDGPQRQNIEARIKELGIGRWVRLLGLRTDVPAVLNGVDLFVLPTLQEALGTSILEASAMRKAVISTKVGGVPEVIVEGKTGLLVEPEDSAGLCSAIVALLTDARARESMGAQGRRLVESDFSTTRMVEKMHDLYTNLAAVKHG